MALHRSEFVRADVVKRELGAVDLVHFRESVVFVPELAGKLAPQSGLGLFESLSDIGAVLVVGGENVSVKSSGDGESVPKPASKGQSN